MGDFVTIGDRRVGAGFPCYVMAELSGNHNGDLDRAIETIRAAADAGADAVKIQTYTPDTMTLDLGTDEFVVPGDGPWGGADALRPVSRSPHAMGLARSPVRYGAEGRNPDLLDPVRRDCRQSSRGARSACIQDCVL